MNQYESGKFYEGRIVPIHRGGYMRRPIVERKLRSVLPCEADSPYSHTAKATINGKTVKVVRYRKAIVGLDHCWHVHTTPARISSNAAPTPVTFKRKLVLKECPYDFGLGKGVIAEDEITYEKRKKDADDYLLAVQISRDNRDWINSHVEVQIEEVED